MAAAPSRRTHGAFSIAPQLASGPTPAGSSGDGTLQIWSLESSSGGWSHPVHAHFEEAIILRVDGHDPPEWERWARKDMFRLGVLKTMVPSKST